MMDPQETIVVGIASGAIAKAPRKIRTLGLGSCVAVMLYDLVSGVGGLAHILLPEAPVHRPIENPTKFADSAIPWLIQGIEARGGASDRLFAKLVGGGQMFTSSQTMQGNVGGRNVEACRHLLHLHGISVEGDDVGGNYGRSVELDIATGIVTVRTAVKGAYLL